MAPEKNHWLQITLFLDVIVTFCLSIVPRVWGVGVGVAKVFWFFPFS